MSTEERREAWSLAANSAHRFAREAEEIANALTRAHIGVDGGTIVPSGTAAHARKARALASLVVELTAEAS